MKPSVYCLVLLLLIEATSSLGAQRTLRVVSYNIHHGRGTDGRIDLPRLARVIGELEPDLVALQEVDVGTKRCGGVDQAAELGRLTKLSYAFGKAMDFDGGAYGVAVLSRFKIVTSVSHALPAASGHEPRVALETTIATPDGASLRFICTHLDHTRGTEVRMSQAAKLNELFGQPTTERIILAGDLNARPTADEMQLLFQDWRPASLKSPAPTYPSRQPRLQIDYVLLHKSSAWRVPQTRVADQPIASDHAPLIAELAAVDPSASQLYPDRTNLLIYRDSEGKQQQVDDIDDWERNRGSVLRAMQTIMGRLPGEPKRCDLDMRIVEEVDCGSYVRRLIDYAAEPNSRVPAYLLIPRHVVSSPEPAAAAVLCLHPTDNQFGHQVVVGLGGRANRQYAQELAERGYVTLAPAYPLLADYHPNLASLGYQSGTMKAIWDNMRGVDLLQSLPYVRRDAIGAIGHSLGGHNAVYTAVFDPRIKAVVSSCGLDSYVDYKRGDLRGWTGPRYMPRLLDYMHCPEAIPFDFHEMVAALAPRHCLLIAPRHDDNFGWRSVDRVAHAASSIYALYGHRERLQVAHPEGGHDFPLAMRKRAYALLDSALRTD